MLVKDIMTKTVITVSPGAPVGEIAQTMVSAGISGMPVVDGTGKVIGIISEGDLMRRTETETAPRRSWWLKLLGSPTMSAEDYIRSHGMKASDLMHRSVISVSPDDTLGKAAQVLEGHHIKRAPVIENGKLVGIISRSNLVQALSAIYGTQAPEASVDDASLRAAVEHNIAETGVSAFYLNVVVSNGIVDLWGVVSSQEERNAVRIAAESTPGVKGVQVHITANPQLLSGV